jgi:hypothetical protein
MKQPTYYELIKRITCEMEHPLVLVGRKAPGWGYAWLRKLVDHVVALNGGNELFSDARRVQIIDRLLNDKDVLLTVAQIMSVQLSDALLSCEGWQGSDNLLTFIRFDQKLGLYDMVNHRGLYLLGKYMKVTQVEAMARLVKVHRQIPQIADYWQAFLYAAYRQEEEDQAKQLSMFPQEDKNGQGH